VLAPEYPRDLCARHPHATRQVGSRHRWFAGQHGSILAHAFVPGRPRLPSLATLPIAGFLRKIPPPSHNPGSINRRLPEQRQRAQRCWALFALSVRRTRVGLVTLRGGSQRQCESCSRIPRAETPSSLGVFVLKPEGVGVSALRTRRGRRTRTCDHCKPLGCGKNAPDGCKV
jgi:hypothetical protein